LILTLLTFEINVVFFEFLLRLILPVLFNKTLLLLPIFQRSLLTFFLSVLQRECKGKGIFNSTNFFKKCFYKKIYRTSFN